jgi:hypothetical protein
MSETKERRYQEKKDREENPQLRIWTTKQKVVNSQSLPSETQSLHLIFACLEHLAYVVFKKHNTINLSLLRIANE